MTSLATRTKRGLRPHSVLTVVLSLLVLILVLYPVLTMLSRSFSAESIDSWRELLAAPWLAGMVFDTLFVVLTSALLALLIAALIAWINTRTDAGIGIFGDALPLIPLFLPIVAMAIGWVMLANPKVGFINGFLAATIGRLGIDFQVNIYSYAGLIFVYTLNLVPYAYLPIAASFRSLDPSLEEAARVSGASPLQVFYNVALRSIMPAILAGLVLVSVVGFAMYSVPTIIGTRSNIDIVAVRIIRSIRNVYPPQYDIALLLSTILFIFLAALWMFQRRMTGTGNFAKVGARSPRSAVVNLGRWKWLARSVLLVYVLLAAILPIVALVLVSFQTFWQPDVFSSTWTLKHHQHILLSYPLGLKSIQNSLLLGLGGGAVTVLIAAVVMVYAYRAGNRLGRFADAVAKSPAAVPNTVLAVAFIFAFAGPPFRLGGTLLILGLAYFVVYIPYASLVSEAAVAQVDRSLEEASSLSGASEGRTFRGILLPLMAPALFAAWALVFVRVLGDLSVAVLLGTGRTPVIGFVLLDVWDQGSFNRTASLALIMTAITMPIVMLMIRLGQPRWSRTGSGR